MKYSLDELVDRALEDDRIGKTEVRVLKCVAFSLNSTIPRHIDVRSVSGKLSKTADWVRRSVQVLVQFGYLEKKNGVGQIAARYTLPFTLPICTDYQSHQTSTRKKKRRYLPSSL